MSMSLKQRIAREAVNHIPANSVVNFGYGIPCVCYEFMDHTADGVRVHGESGILGAKGNWERDDKQLNPSIVDPAGTPAIIGADGQIQNSIMDAFAFIDAGKVDVSMLGAFQVSKNGDLANWATNDGRLAGLGGARALAQNSGKVVVCMIEHTRSGERKLVDELTYPVTFPGRVSLVVTDLGVYEIANGEFKKIKEWDDELQSYKKL